MGTVDPVLWRQELNDFTLRNAARPMDLDILMNELGAQPEVHRFALRGVSYDSRDRRIDIMFGRDADAHVTHSIGGVESIDVIRSRDGRSDVLQIRHEGGQTILHVSPASAGGADRRIG
jgi:hypothetical protein